MAKSHTPSSQNPQAEWLQEPNAAPQTAKRSPKMERLSAGKLAMPANAMPLDVQVPLIKKPLLQAARKTMRDDEDALDQAEASSTQDAPSNVTTSLADAPVLMAQVMDSGTVGAGGEAATSGAVLDASTVMPAATSASVSMSTVALVAGGLAVVAAAGGGGSSGEVKDTTPPTPGALSLGGFIDSGSGASDKISSDKSFSLSLAGQESGSTVVYQVKSGSTWTTTTLEQSNLADGTYVFRALVKDAAGNEAVSNEITVVVDTVAPAAGTLSLGGFIDSGHDAHDFLTSDRTFDLNLSGQEAGSTVVYQKSLNGGDWISTTAAQSNLADGVYRFRTLVTDAAGNSAVSNEVSVTVDATAPTPAVQTASGTVITLAFDGVLDGDHLPAPSAFTVAQGSNNFTVSTVELVGTDTIKLTLASALSTGALTLTYTDPTAVDDAGAIQDAAGNDVSTFTTGVLADGYISGATIQIDTDGDGVGDVLVGKTDAGGRFFVNAEAQTLLSQGGVLIATGGFNIDTGVANTIVLKSAGALTINPLTTVIQALVESNTGITVEEAATQVATNLGITLAVGQSLNSYDPIASGDTDAQKVAAQIATVATLAASTAADNGAQATAAALVMNQLATVISNASTNGVTGGAGQPAVSLSDTGTLNNLVSAVTLTGDSTVQETLKSTIAQAAIEIASATSLSEVSAKQSQFLDRAAPAAPTIGNQEVTQDNTPDVTLALEVKATDGTAVVATDKLILMEGDREIGTYTLGTSGADLVKGAIKLTLPTLSDGLHTLQAFVVDQSGNVGNASTFSLSVDTTAPLVPVVNAVTGDDVINASETSFTVTGAAEAGATVKYGASLSAVAGADGSWSLTLPASAVSQLSEGSNTLSFTATDAAGNVSAAGTRVVTVDRVAPTVTSGLPRASDNVEPTVGDVPASGTTNDNTPTLSGTLSAALAAGDQVVIYDGSTRLGAATVTGTDWTFAAPALSNAAHSITARVQDAAGNSGAASADFTFTVNATVPVAVPTITALTDDVGSAQDLTQNGLTNDAAPLLKGQLSAALATGELVKVFDGKGNHVGDATVSDTSWSLSLSNLSDGPQSYKAVVQNAGGNQGAMSAAFAVTVDTQAPATSAITVNVVTGDSKVSGVEKTAGFAVAGTAEPGSQVQLTWGSTVKTATTSAAGQWRVALTSTDVPADSASSTISVVATDAAGNASSAVSSANIVIDTQGPSGTTLNAVATDNKINAAEAAVGVVLTGTTEANATVLLPIGSSIVRTLAANEQGVFSYTLTQADIKVLGEGTGKTLGMTAIDTSGNRASAVPSATFVIDTVAPVLSPFSWTTNSDTGVSATDGISKNRTPAISFTVEDKADTTVVVEVASVSQGVVGQYSAVSGFSKAAGSAQTAALNLTNDGAYSVRVTATDAVGNTSVREGKYVLDTVAPTAPSAGQFNLADSSDSGVKNDGISNVNRPTAEFILEKGVTLASEYRVKDTASAYTAAGSVVATGASQTATMENALPADGQYEFHYTLTDVAGNKTEFQRYYTLDSTAPTVVSISDATADAFTNAPIRFTVTFSEALVADAGLSNFTATNGTVSAVSKVDATHYNVDVVPQPGVASGNVALSLVGAGLKDSADNVVSNANLASLDAQGIDTLAPVIDSASAVTVAENGSAASVVYTATASDVRGVSYGLSGTDEALFRIDSVTGAVTFKASPNYEAPTDADTNNRYEITVVATDALGNASTKAVALTVSDVNDAPTARDIGPQTLVNGEVLDGNLSDIFSDVDAGLNGTLSYALKVGSVLPAGVSLSSAGVFSGAATADAAPVNVTFVATDGGGLSVEQTVSIAVVSAPVIQSFTITDATTTNGANVGKSGEALTFAVKLSEAVTLTGGAPTISFNMGGQSVEGTYQSGSGTDTLIFTGVAPSTGSGTTTQVTGIDLKGATVIGNASQQFWATGTTGQSSSSYTLDNTAPTISTSSLSVAENSTAVSGTLSANEGVTWSLGTGANEDLFTLSGATLSLKAAKNYEVDVTNTHAYTVNVVAKDTAGNQTSKAITINLTDVNEAPTARDIGPQTLVNGEALLDANLSDIFSDVDAGLNGTLSYALKAGSVLPAGLSLVDGVVIGTPTADSAAVNVTFVATDGGGLSVEQTVSIAVVSAPVIQSFTITDATTTNGANVGKSGEALTFAVKLSEAVTLTGGAPTISFNMGGQSVEGTYQSGSGTDTLIFTGVAPTNGSGTTTQVTGINLNGATVIGNASQQFWATGTTGQSSSSYTLDNTAPTISTSSLSVAENSTAVSGTLSANEGVTWSMGTGANEDLFTLSGATLSLKAAKNYEVDVTNTHAYTVNVVAKDTAGNQTSKAITINLTDVNEAPTARDIGPQTLVNGEALLDANLSDIFSDVDAGLNGTLSYALKAGSVLPAGLSLVDGVVIGTPTADSAAVNVTFVATDGGGLSVEQTVSIAVASAPTLSAGDLGAQTALDVSSNLVLSVGETVTGVAGKFIHITDLGGTHYRGENATHSFVVDAKDVTIVGSGAQTKIVIDPSALFDLDLSSTYSIEVEAGAFMGSTSHQASVAMSAVSFGTVTPGTSLAAAAQAYRMDDTTGAVALANKWVDIEGNGSGTSNIDSSTAIAFDAAADNFTFVFKDNLIDGGNAEAGSAGIETLTDFAVVLKNFGSGDRVYVDDSFNDPTKLDIPSAEVFAQGNGSAGSGALKWGLSGGGGDPQLYIELASVVSLGSTLAQVNSVLGLSGQGYSSAVLVF